VTGDRRLRLAPVELLGIAAFWTAIAIITALGSRLDPRLPDLDPRVARGLMSLAFIEYAMWAVITGPVIWLASRYSVEGGRRLTRVFGFIAVGVVVAVLVDFSLGFFRGEVLFPLTDRRPGPPPRIAIEFLDDFMVYLAILGTGIARDYFLRYRIRADEMVQLQAHTAGLQAQLAKAELSVLRSQLNPHFLFNTLHAVSSLVERDPSGVRKMIARLSELLRMTLEGTPEHETTLDKELDMLRRYVEIMEIRYQGKLNVATQIEPEVREALVPSMVLQPIVENAMKHGVDESKGAAKITIDARRQAGYLVVRVIDTGPGPGRSKLATGGVGLENTKARLRQLYGPSQSFVLEAAPGGGAAAELRIPFHTTPVTTAEFQALSS
jgi:two-component system LytT family sensor kinase